MSQRIAPRRIVQVSSPPEGSLDWRDADSSPRSVPPSRNTAPPLGAGLGGHGGARLVDDAAAGKADFAADDHGMGAGVDFPAAERRIVALRAESRGVDLPAGLGVDDGDIGIRAGA